MLSSTRYPELMIAPLREETRRLGAEDLRTPEAVDAFVARSEGSTAMVIVNSVCGCSTGTLLPALRNALGRVRPDRIGTVFAGADLEATARARELFTGYRPSSPAIALFRDRELVFMLQRHDIQGHPPDRVADALVEGIGRHASSEGAARA